LGRNSTDDMKMNCVHILNVGTRCRKLTSFTLLRFHPQHPLDDRRLAEPHNRSGRHRGKGKKLPFLELRLLGCPVRRIVDTPTELTRLQAASYTRRGSGGFPVPECTAFKIKLFIPVREHKSMCLLQFRGFDWGVEGVGWRREPVVICQPS
jgi:hypothetical protein